MNFREGPAPGSRKPKAESANLPARTYVHVGYQRTGTSFLQEKLFARISPPRLIRDIPELFELCSYLDLDMTGGFSAHLTDTACIFSCEQIASSLDRDLPEHAGDIAEQLPEAEIIVTVRSQYSLFRGLYFLYLKGGGREGFVKFVHCRAGQLATFSQTIGAYVDKFGADRVHVVLHEDLVAAPRATMRNLLAIMHLDPAIAETVEQHIVKPSASDLILRLLRIRNAMVSPITHFLPRRLRKSVYRAGLPGATILDRIIGSRFQWSLPLSAVRPVLRQAYGRDNAALFETLGKDISAYDYPQPGSD